MMEGICPTVLVTINKRPYTRVSSNDVDNLQIVPEVVSVRWVDRVMTEQDDLFPHIFCHPAS